MPIDEHSQIAPDKEQGEDFNRTVVVNRPQHEGSNATPLRKLAMKLSRKKQELEDLIGGKNVSQYTDAVPDTTAQLDAPLSNLDTKYSVLEEYAHGGHATVSIARDKNLRRIVAIKSLKKEAGTREEIVDSFVSEAKVTAQLDHPGIIPIYGLTSDGDKGVHLIMKLVNGKTLRDYLRNITLNYRVRGIKVFDEAELLRKRLEIFLRVCDAMSYAHHKNIIHRDLKPENIMLGEYMEVFVVDWGLAKVISKDDEEQDHGKGNITGTPRYFPPEALRGERCDARSDIFTLGLILQEIVTLQFAVKGKNEKEYMERIVNGELEPVKHLFGWRIDKALEAIIKKATVYRPDDRYQTVKELSEDLRRYMGGLSVDAYPDNVFMALMRYCNSHRREFMAGILLILLLFSAITAYSVYGRLRASRELNIQRRAMNYAFNRTSVVSKHIDIVALHIQEQLSALSRLVAYMLAYNNECGKDEWKKAFHPTTSKIDEPGMFYSPYYKRMTSLDYGVYTFAPNSDPQTCADFVQKAFPILRKMKNIVLGSKSDYAFDEKDFEKLKADYLYNGFPVRTVFVGSSSGVKLLYPWRAINYSQDVDPREREWYKDAQKKRGPTWGKPYMDIDSVSGLKLTCSVPIYAMNGEFSGVVGLDLSVNRLTNSILSMGNTGDYVIEKAVINLDGETIFSSKSEYFNKSFDPDKFHKDVEFETPHFRTESIRNRILRQGNSYGAFADNGLVYSFAHLEIFNMYYVVVADYNKLVSYIRENNL